MSSIAELNNFIQGYLKENGISEISAVDIAQVLDAKGLLQDSDSRPGLPLRRLLRANRIIGSYQYPNNRWVIRPTDSETFYSPKEAAEKLNITDKSVYSMLEKDQIAHQAIGDKKLIPQSAVEDQMIKRGIVKEDKEIIKKMIAKEILAIQFEVENIMNRLNTIKQKLNIKED